MVAQIAVRRGLVGLLGLAAGAMSVLGFAPFGMPAFALLGPAILLVIALRSDPKLAFRFGWLWGIGFFASGIWWVYISVADYGQGGPPAGALITTLFVAFLALFPASVAAFTAWVKRHSLIVAALAAWPAAWVSLEWLRSWIFTGFPWISLGYSQIDWPLAGYAPIVGVFGVSGLLVLTMGASIAFVFVRNLARVILLICIVGVWVFGWQLRNHDWTQPIDRPITVALVQGNIPQDIKWQEEHMDPTMQLYWELTQDAWGRQLIVWPETAIPRFYDEVEHTFVAELRKHAALHNSEMIVGIPYYDFETKKYYNTLMSVGKKHAFYKKSHLVPFGEYLPFRAWLGTALDFLGAAQEDYSPADVPQGPMKVTGQAIGASICYEDAFGEEIIQTLPEATLLVNVSNDGWFGDSIAPPQHLQMAQMRALETGRDMLRSTNTGISALIDHRGRIVTQSPMLQTHVLFGSVQPRSGATPYVRWGNGPVVLVSLLVLILVVAAGRLRRQ